MKAGQRDMKRGAGPARGTARSERAAAPGPAPRPGGASGVPGGKMRLQRFLADSGVASRRQCEELILEGQIVVNNAVVDTLPAFVDPERDIVLARGVRVRPQRPEYFLVHKPRGVVCTNRDPDGRSRAIDLLPPLKARLFVVGRLDEESEGLLLMTNDGELAARVTHPRYGVAKVYRAEVRGQVPAELPEQLRKGVWLSEGKARIGESTIIHSDRQHSIVEITARESGNREIRRIFARLGHRIRRLKRIRIGPLSLAGLPRGAARRLSEQELRELQAELLHPQATQTGRRRAAGPRRTCVRAGQSREASKREPLRRGAAGPARKDVGVKPVPAQADSGPKPKRRVVS